MSYSPMFTADLLTRDEEVDLARQIEVGVLAKEKLKTPGHWHHADLAELVRRGEEAWDRLWSANLRLAMSIARTEAGRANLNIDDIFQEACLGLADAMMRFDYMVGVRFSTFAYAWIRQRAYLACLTRGGRRDIPIHRLRTMRRLRLPDATTEVVPVEPHTLESLCSTLETDALAGEPPWWFLHLNEREESVLKLRYGFCGRPRTQTETAAALNLSLGQVRRAEQAAFTKVRALYAGNDAA